MHRGAWILGISIWTWCGLTAAAQEFAAGADVSFLRQQEQKGIVYTDSGEPKPGLRILKDHGYTWVRLRIFNNPKTLPNDLAYTIASTREAKALGFKLLLDFHYADDWADPAHQPTPEAWKRLDHAALGAAVFAYTRDTIAAFRQAGVTPEMVQIGNEITNGMLWPDGQLPDHWERLAGLILAGEKGVAAGSGSGPMPKIMIHIDQGGNQETTKWFFDTLATYHVPYDIIGQSYYPWWQGSLNDLRDNLRFMATTYHKDVIVVETAYDWKVGEVYKKGKAPFPETPEGQRDFLRALAQVVRATPGEHGKGVFWWEPAADGEIAKRGLFADDHGALPALNVFDP